MTIGLRSNLLSRGVISLLILLLFAPLSHSKTPDDWRALMQLIMEIEEAESADWQDNEELLDELSQHPINLNNATWEDFSRLSFLSDEQIDDILAYVWQYGPVRSVSELAMIESLDYYQRRLLQCFVTVESSESQGLPPLRTIADKGKHDLTINARIPFYDRQGDKKGYEGYPYRHSLRYSFSYSNKLKIGIVGSQDAGEPFFAGKNNKGYDYYSYYFSLSNIGKLKKLIVGKYRASFGMGLVVNNNLILGKLANITSLGRRRNSIVEHSSRSEANYLNGIASTIEILRNVDFSIVGSYRTIDATLAKDNNSIQTLLTSGYHRTESELSRKGNAKEGLLAANISYNSNGWHLGTTALYNRYSLPLKPNTTQLYRRWQAEGQNFWNIGVDYGYRHYKFSVQGETATGNKGSIATINRLTFNPSNAISLVALQRFYGYKYVATHARSIGNNSRVQNESGFYLGGQWKPTSMLTIQGYLDFAHFAWPRYLVDFTSDAVECFLQALAKKKDYSLLLRYSFKYNEKNNETKTALLADKTQRLRLALMYSKHDFAAKIQGDYAINDYKEKSQGWMLSAVSSYRFKKLAELSLLGGYFDTDSYQSRHYLYLPGLLYQMSFSSFYGNGIVVSGRIRVDISEQLMLMTKITYCNYFDRNTISSGLQQINASHQTDLELQLRYHF